MLAAETLARPVGPMGQEIVAMKICKPATSVENVSVWGLRHTGTSLQG